MTTEQKDIALAELIGLTDIEHRIRVTRQHGRKQSTSTASSFFCGDSDLLVTSQHEFLPDSTNPYLLETILLSLPIGVRDKVGNAGAGADLCESILRSVNKWQDTETLPMRDEECGYYGRYADIDYLPCCASVQTEAEQRSLRGRATMKQLITVKDLLYDVLQAAESGKPIFTKAVIEWRDAHKHWRTGDPDRPTKKSCRKPLDKPRATP